MLKVFCAPARYTQGPDATLHLGPEIQNLGLEGPALIVAGRSAIRLLTPTWQSTFAQTNTQYEMFPFAGECTAAEVQRGREAAHQIQAKIIIGAGGVKNMRGGASTQSALALAELCYKTLLADGVAATVALQTQTPNAALERLVEANTLLSGLGFESSGLAAAHAVHNGLTTAHGTHAYMHGEKVAFGLLTQLMLESQPQATINEVIAFAKSVGLPTTFAEIGIPNPSPETLQTIATRATLPGETIHNEPMPVTPVMVVEAMRAADAAGQSL